MVFGNVTGLKRLALFALVAAVPALASTQSFGHHSAAAFDSNKVLELTGTVKQLQWTNPHIWIQIYVKNEKGESVEWSVEGGSPATLFRSGWRPSAFKAGTEITVRLHPMLNGTAAGEMMGVKLPDGTTLGRWNETQEQKKPT